MSLPSVSEGYSAKVKLELIVPEFGAIDVAQVGPESLILRNAVDVPSGPAQLIITVDGKRETSDVILSGNRDGTKTVAYF